MLLRKITLTCTAVVNQVYLHHRAASQRLQFLGPSTLHNLSRMQALRKHRQAASLATLRSRHRQAASLAPLRSPHRQAASLEIRPHSRHKRAASLGILPPSHNKEEVCSARIKIKLETTSNSNKAPLSSVATKVFNQAGAFLGHSKIISRVQVDSLA